MTECAKPQFAPLPMRACSDRRLYGLPMALLAIIAAHDRFNSNGQGCWASRARLAELAQCDQRYVSEVLGRLEDLGYIASQAAPEDRRRRIYTVLYTDEDQSAFAGREKGRPQPTYRTEKGRPQPTYRTEKGRPQPTECEPKGGLEPTNLEATNTSKLLISNADPRGTANGIYFAKQKDIGRSPCLAGEKKRLPQASHGPPRGGSERVDHSQPNLHGGPLAEVLERLGRTVTGPPRKEADAGNSHPEQFPENRGSGGLKLSGEAQSEPQISVKVAG